MKLVVTSITSLILSGGFLICILGGCHEYGTGPGYSYSTQGAKQTGENVQALLNKVELLESTVTLLNKKIDILNKKIDNLSVR